jgi:hypothetical protein
MVQQDLGHFETALVVKVPEGHINIPMVERVVDRHVRAPRQKQPDNVDRAFFEGTQQRRHPLVVQGRIDSGWVLVENLVDGTSLFMKNGHMQLAHVRGAKGKTRKYAMLTRCNARMEYTERGAQVDLKQSSFATQYGHDGTYFNRRSSMRHLPRFHHHDQNYVAVPLRRGRVLPRVL